MNKSYELLKELKPGSKFSVEITEPDSAVIRYSTYVFIEWYNKTDVDSLLSLYSLSSGKFVQLSCRFLMGQELVYNGEVVYMPKVTDLDNLIVGAEFTIPGSSFAYVYKLSNKELNEDGVKMVTLIDNETLYTTKVPYEFCPILN